MLAVSVDRPRLRRAVEAPVSLLRGLRARLDTLSHAARRTTDLPEGPETLDVLSRVDLLRIALVSRSLDRPGVRDRLLGWVREARDEGVETGGVVTLEEGRVRWRKLPSASDEAGRYRRPEEPRFDVELAGFHLHATAEDDRPAAGPSLMDALSAAFHGGPRLVLTDLGADCFDVDYYRDAVAGRLVDAPRSRLDAVALDLGVYCTADGGRTRPREGGA